MRDEARMEQLVDAVRRALDADDPYLEGLHFEHETVDEALDVPFFELHGIEFDHCSFVGTNFAKTSFYDCTLTECDFSNAGLDETYFARTRLVGCKLAGATLNKAFMRSTRRISCMLRYANLGEATLEGTTFVDCDKREAFLNEMRLRKASRFERCNLTRADFFRTSLKGIDLSTCEIAGIGVSDTHSELVGALIAADQAVDLVGMLGVKVLQDLE